MKVGRTRRAAAFVALALVCLLAGAAAAVQPVTDPIPVSPNTLEDHTNPAVAAAADGRFFVAWEAETSAAPDDAAIRMRRFGADGSPLNASSFVTPIPNVDDHRDPQIAANAAGDGAVVYTIESTPTNIGVWARRFDGDSGPTTSQFEVDGPTTGIRNNPDVAVDSTGTLAVAFEGPGEDTNVTTDRGVYVRFGNSFADVSEVDPDEQRDPAVAVNAAGDTVVVVWASPDGTQARLFNANLTPKDDQFTVEAGGDAQQRDLAVEMAGDGSFAVLWERCEGLCDARSVGVRRFAADGTPLTGEIPVTSGGNFELHPTLGVSNSGNFAVAFEGVSLAPPGQAYVVKEYDASGTESGASFADAPHFPDNDENELHPALTVSPTGRLYIAYGRDDPSITDEERDYDIFARVLRRDGDDTVGPQDPPPQDPPPQDPPESPPPGGLDDVPPGGFGIGSNALTMDAKNRVRIVVNGPANELAPSTGVASLVTAGKVQASAKRRVKLAGARFTVAPGQRKVVVLKLKRGKAKLVKRLKKVRVRLAVTLADSTGNKSAVVAKRLLLKAKRRR